MKRLRLAKQQRYAEQINRALALLNPNPTLHTETVTDVWATTAGRDLQFDTTDGRFGYYDRINGTIRWSTRVIYLEGRWSRLERLP